MYGFDLIVCNFTCLRLNDVLVLLLSIFVWLSNVNAMVICLA